MTSPNENYTSWHCGMKVVCVDASPDAYGQTELVQWRVYQIAEVNPYFCCLVEFPAEEGEFAPDWRLSRFRPVQTRKTDISIFQRILSNPHKKIHKVEGERV